MSTRVRRRARRTGRHAGRRRWFGPASGFRYLALLGYGVIACGPILLIAISSFKSKRAIFDDPLGLPWGDAFSTAGYETVLATATLQRLVGNSLIVAAGTVALVLLLGSMAAFALASYRFRGNKVVSFYLFVGILVPAALGSVVTLQLFVALGLIDTLLALILINSALSLPLAVFILAQFLREVPRELIDAARVDGASELALYRLTLHFVRPALATVAVLTMIPAWNDLWWPLILTGSQESMTLILGAQRFVGQYATDWGAILAIVTVAMVPVLVLYAIFSRQLIRGLMGGAVK